MLIATSVLALLLAQSVKPTDTMARGTQAFHQRRFPAAEREFRRLSTRPARLYLARTLIELQRFEEALAQLELVLAGNPDPETTFRAGEILRDLAERRLAALQREAPDSAAVPEMTGVSFERAGRLDDALRNYRHAAQIDPNRPGVHYRIGAILWRQRDLDAATIELQVELARTPDHGMANLRLGQVLLARDLATEAIPPLERGLAAMPGSPEAQRELGKAYRKVGRQQDARRVFEALARTRPNDDQVHFQLGSLYRELGLTAESQREFRLHSAILAKRSAGAGGTVSGSPVHKRP